MSKPVRLLAMFGKCVAAFLVLASCVYAEDSLIEAKLRFLIWEDRPQAGLLVDASQVEKLRYRDERLSLVQGSESQEVRVSSLRCSSTIDYQGDGQVRLVRGDEEVAHFTLPRSGEYYVLLSPKVGQYRAFAVELNRLQEGEVLFVNHSDYRCSVKEAEGESLLVSSGKSAILKRANAEEHACHLTMHCWREGKWMPDSARYYSLKPSSKSLCMLYRDQGYSRLRLRFFSGL